MRLRSQACKDAIETAPDRPACLREARLVIELMAARRAASQPNRRKLGEIRRAFDEMSATSGDLFAHAYVRFHLSVARAGNAVLETLLACLLGEVERSLVSDPPDPVTIRRWLEQHDQVVRCIVGRDPDGCVRAMCGHLDPEHAYTRLVRDLP